MIEQAVETIVPTTQDAVVFFPKDELRRSTLAVEHGPWYLAHCAVAKAAGTATDVELRFLEKYSDKLPETQRWLDAYHAAAFDEPCKCPQTAAKAPAPPEG